MNITPKVPRLLIKSVDEYPRFPNWSVSGPVEFKCKILLNAFSVFTKSNEAICNNLAKKVTAFDGIGTWATEKATISCCVLIIPQNWLREPDIKKFKMTCAATEAWLPDPAVDNKLFIAF